VQSLISGEPLKLAKAPVLESSPKDREISPSKYERLVQKSEFEQLVSQFGRQQLKGNGLAGGSNELFKGQPKAGLEPFSVLSPIQGGRSRLKTPA